MGKARGRPSPGFQPRHPLHLLGYRSRLTRFPPHGDRWPTPPPPAKPTADQLDATTGGGATAIGLAAAAVAGFEPVRRRQVGMMNTASQQAVVYGLSADAFRAGRPLAELPRHERAVYDQYLDEAFAGLHEAVTEWDWLEVVGLKTDPDFDPLRADARFADAARAVEARLAGRKF